MAIRKCGSDYLESIQKKEVEAYMFGKRCDMNVFKDPMLGPCSCAAASAYDFMAHPGFQERWYKESSFIPGEKVNIMMDLFRTPEEWINRLELMRIMTRRSFCTLRCVYVDALQGTYMGSWECDKKYGTNYHDRLTEVAKQMQKEDAHIAWGIIDSKGVRERTLGEQEQPNVGVHVVDRKKDGVIVRGCKSNTTFGPYMEYLMISPGNAPYTEKDKDYAVSFLVPTDAKGLKFICRPPGFRQPKKMDFPISSRFGFSDAITVFDDVFIPNEYLFLDGEWEFAYRYWELVMGIHMWAKGGCMAGQGDLLVGIGSLLRKYNGLEKFEHVKHKINEMIWVNELGYNACIGAAYRAVKHPSGTCYPHRSGAASKYLTRKHKLGCLDDIMDIAGGAVVTGPADEEYENPETRKYLEEAMSGKDCTTEERVRMLKLAEDFVAGDFGGLQRAFQIHAGGPPWAQLRELWESTDFEDLEATAKVWAGIEKADKIGWGFPE